MKIDRSSTSEEELIRIEETHVLATTADGKAAALWGEGKRNCKNSAFGWVLIGWVLGRSLNFATTGRCSLMLFKCITVRGWGLALLSADMVC